MTSNPTLDRIFTEIQGDIDELERHLTDLLMESLELMTDPEILRLAMERSGMMARQFARHLPERPSVRNVQRWLAGHHPLPQSVREYCVRLILEPGQPERTD